MPLPSVGYFGLGLLQDFQGQRGRARREIEYAQDLFLWWGPIARPLFAPDVIAGARNISGRGRIGRGCRPRCRANRSGPVRRHHPRPGSRCIRRGQSCASPSRMRRTPAYCGRRSRSGHRRAHQRAVELIHHELMFGSDLQCRHHLAVAIGGLQRDHARPPRPCCGKSTSGVNFHNHFAEAVRMEPVANDDEREERWPSAS